MLPLLALLIGLAPRQPPVDYRWHPNAHLTPDSSAPGVHDVPYKSRRRHGRGRTLTTEEVQPINIHVDFSSLYEETAPKYSACFKVGDWFKFGMPPGDKPPRDGKETCIRHSSTGYITARSSEPSALDAIGRRE